MSSWFETVSSRVVHEGFSTVRIDEVRMPDGSTVEREIVEHVSAVAVVPVVDGDVLLLRQYRHAVGGYVLEIPAGILDVDGEDPAEAARRELAEEIHHEAAELRELMCFQNSSGWTDETTTVYLGTDLRPVDPPDDFAAQAEEADMEVVRLPLAVALDEVRVGRISDAKTVIGLLLAADRLRS